MNLVHVHQRFQAVGHGTFFTGLAASDDDDAFSWIYDCGSKRKKRLTATMDDILMLPDQINMLVLSHFDDDHVNGVEYLLTQRCVQWLVIPYLNVAQRLAQAASVGQEALSVSTAMFQLDPAGWLMARGLADRVNAILFIRGSDGQDTDNVEASPLPDSVGLDLPQEESQEDAWSEGAQAIMEMRLTSADNRLPKALMRLHTQPVKIQKLALELMFFNSKQPDLFKLDSSGSSVAKRSGAALAQVQKEIEVIVNRFRLNDLSRPPRRRWREELKVCYERHFGSTSQTRNNISLCLLVRPLAFTNTNPPSCCDDDCFWFFWCGMLYPSYCDKPVCMQSIHNRAGLLCTGDLRLDRSTITKMMLHFGNTRWNQIGLTQVPHHGSQHSWETGSAATFAPSHFVHCVPNESKQHPHNDVQMDLIGHTTYKADYEHSVTLNYHFKP